MTTRDAPRRGKLAGIQVLRGAAALAVAIHHAQHEATLFAAGKGENFARLDPFAWSAGIDVFFVISGFIMVYASERVFGRRDAPRHFLARRIARIVPLYWIATSLYLLIALASPAALSDAVIGPGYVLGSYLFVPMLRPGGSVVPFYSLGWTLNYEMFFYGLFALAIWLPRRGAVLAVSAALGLLVLLGIMVKPLPEPLAFWTGPVILEFALGMAIGLAYAEGVRLNAVTRIALAGAALALLTLSAGTGGLGPERAIQFGPAAAMLVASVALAPSRSMPRGPLIRGAALVGDASYALYLLHPFAIRGVRLLTEASGLARVLPAWGFVALSLCGAVALAVVVFLLVERPLTVLVRRALDPRRGDATDQET